MRFYGFDLSSIEQEANVTVNTEDSSATTPEVPTSTVSSTIPMEPIDTRNEPDTTTTLTITALPSETTITSSTATPQNVTEEQSITVASLESTVPSMSSPDSLSAVTSEESVQPTSTTIITNDQAFSTTVVAEDAGRDESVGNTMVPDSTENAKDANASDDTTSNANIQAPQGIDRTTTAVDVLGDGTQRTDVSTAINVDATSVNIASVTDEDTVTTNSLITAISTSLIGATNSTTPSPVIETTDNSVISQSRMTSVSAELPAGNTPEMITRDLATTPIINVNHDATTISSVQGINTTITSSDLVGDSNDSTIVNSTDNQANGNVVSTNRKKKGAEPDLKVVTNDGTVRGESTNRGSPNLRRTRSPRGYFSSYPGTIRYLVQLKRVN